MQPHVFMGLFEIKSKTTQQSDGLKMTWLWNIPYIKKLYGFLLLLLFIS